MGLNSKLIKRIYKTTTEDVLHSTGYAKVQNSGFGAASTETFARRSEIEQNRKLIQGYRNARVAQGVNFMPRPRTYAEEKAIQEAKKALQKSKDEQCDEVRATAKARQEFNSRLEAGGLREIPKSGRSTLSKDAKQSGIFASGAAARKAAAIQRQATAKRFEASARPAPTRFGR